MTRAAFEQVLERLQANPVLPSFALMHELGHAQLQLWRQIGGKVANPIKQSRKRKPSLRQRIQQVRKAGLTIAAIQPDGTLIIGKPSEANPDADAIDNVTPIDRSDWN
jgi:hypothetical protein